MGWMAVQMTAPFWDPGTLDGGGPVVECRYLFSTGEPACCDADAKLSRFGGLGSSSSEFNNESTFDLFGSDGVADVGDLCVRCSSNRDPGRVSSRFGCEGLKTRPPKDENGVEPS